MDALLLIYRSNNPANLSPVERVKTLLPSSRPCELYAMLQGRLGEKTAWKAFRKQSRVPIKLYHQDEIPDDVRSFLLSYDPELPVILGRTGTVYTVLVSAEEVRALHGDAALLVQRLTQASVLS